MNFRGKVALITGSNSGIGEGIAIKFVSLGANVVITGRNENKIKEVVEKCKSMSNQRILGVRADLLIESEVKCLVEKTVKEFERIDILVNSAGVAENVSLCSSDYMKSFDLIMNTNVRSIQMLTQLVVPYLEITKGNIINISSVAGIKPKPQMIAYRMSKCALNMFTQCLALELGPKGVRVNSVSPAAIRTPMLSKISSLIAVEMVEGFCCKTFPLRRIGEVEEVSELVVYLASDMASFITGVLFPIDGGYLWA